MALDAHHDRPPVDEPDPELEGLLASALEGAPVACAATRGGGHVVAFANAKFRDLVATDGKSAVGRPVTAMLGIPGLQALLDDAFEHSLTFRDEAIGEWPDRGMSWNCTVWPLLHAGRPAGLVVELRTRGPADPATSMQRQVAERMLLGALHEKDLADAAHLSEERAAFLADAGRRLATSVDLKATREAIAALHLPRYAAWCIVDVVEEGGLMSRLAIVHPEPAKQAAAQRLADAWVPKPDDPFGAPAMLRDPSPLAITEDIDAVVAVAAHETATLQRLRELGLGALLTVPMLARGRVIGAITFVGTADKAAYSQEDVQLARDLALRSGLALENAHLFNDAVRLSTEAQTANEAKSRFLAHMSHELRTPLNAIAGYVDIMDLEIHGPVTDAQRSDLQRIKASQQHLLIMINDILDFMQVERGSLAYHISDLPARELLTESFIMLEATIAEKQLTFQGFDCDAAIVVRADRDRALQIIVNLLTNAIKFTPSGGRIVVTCEADDATVLLSVTDTGVGIPAKMQAAVFQPFVQVEQGLTARKGGVGLGLAISRDLARAMDGDITLESTPGEGSRFTLALPRGQNPQAAS